jgi:hypothetical protein
MDKEQENQHSGMCRIIGEDESSRSFVLLRIASRDLTGRNTFFLFVEYTIDIIPVRKRYNNLRAFGNCWSSLINLSGTETRVPVMSGHGSHRKNQSPVPGRINWGLTQLNCLFFKSDKYFAVFKFK